MPESCGKTVSSSRSWTDKLLHLASDVKLTTGYAIILSSSRNGGVKYKNDKIHTPVSSSSPLLKQHRSITNPLTPAYGPVSPAASKFCMFHSSQITTEQGGFAWVLWAALRASGSKVTVTVIKG